MYKKGDLEVAVVSYDAREENGYDDDYKYANKKVIQLPHSCDEWVIGGKEEAEQMIEDLKEAITKLN